MRRRLVILGALFPNRVGHHGVRFENRFCYDRGQRGHSAWGLFRELSRAHRGGGFEFAEHGQHECARSTDVRAMAEPDVGNRLGVGLDDYAVRSGVRSL